MIVERSQLRLVGPTELNDTFNRKLVEVDWLKHASQRNLDVLRLDFICRRFGHSFRTSGKSLFKA